MTTFAIRCDPECPYEPADGYRLATMPTVGDNLTARPVIHCTCGCVVYLVHEVNDTSLFTQ